MNRRSYFKKTGNLVGDSLYYNRLEADSFLDAYVARKRIHKDVEGIAREVGETWEVAKPLPPLQPEWYGTLWGDSECVVESQKGETGSAKFYRDDKLILTLDNMDMWAIPWISID